MRVHKLTDTFFLAHTARTYGQNAHGHTQIDGHINIQVHGSIAAHIQEKKAHEDESGMEKLLTHTNIHG